MAPSKILALALACGAAAMESERQEVMSEATRPSRSLSAFNSVGSLGSSSIVKPLGASSGELPDERFTASSTWRAPFSLFNPWLGRVNARFEMPSAGAWAAAVNQPGEFLQVDLGRDYVLTAIATQGRHLYDQYVTKYKVQTSRDNIQWITYPGDFNGNTDSDTVVVNDIHQRVVARYVRVVAVAWRNQIALRAEIYGYAPECQANADEKIVGQPCGAPRANRFNKNGGEAVLSKEAPNQKFTRGFPLGLETGAIPDGAVTASSTYVPASALKTDGICASSKVGRNDIVPAASGALPAGPAAIAGARFAEQGLAHGLDLEAFLELDLTEYNTAATTDANMASTLGPVDPARVDASFTIEAGAPSGENMPATNSKNQVEYVNTHSQHRFAHVGTEVETTNGTLLVNTAGDIDCNVFRRYAPQFARLNSVPTPYKSGGWKAGVQTNGEWLQVDLGAVQEVDAVGTQGRANSEEWVSSYELHYSQNGRTWEKIEQIFTANSDSVTLVKNVLSRPVLARYVRFIVRSFNQGVGMRVEVFGPGRGQGCLLRCYAARLARSGRVNGASALDAILGGANGLSFLEIDSAASVEAFELAELAVASDMQVEQLVSCCGCPCCAKASPGTCNARRAGKKGKGRRGGRRRTQVVKRSNVRDVAVPVQSNSDLVSSAVADTVKVLLRGNNAGSGATHGGANARTGVAASSANVVGSVKVPSGKTFYVVQRE